MLTFDQIKELMQLVADRGLEGVEIERTGFKVRIEGHKPAPSVGAIAQAVPLAAPVGSSTEVADASPEETEGAPKDEAETALPEGAATVASPIVGTFYAAPNPDAAPFVRVGDRVEVGQVLCIVEAMKLMNEIESDAAGIVVRIFPKNAQPVEFGEPLFAIQAD